MELKDSFTLTFGMFHILIVIINPWLVSKSIIPPIIHAVIIFLMGFSTVVCAFFKKTILRRILGFIYCVSAVLETLNLITWSISGGDIYSFHLFLASLDLIQTTILFS